MRNTSTAKPPQPGPLVSDEVARVVIIDDHPMVREHLTALIKRDRRLSVCGVADDVTTGLAIIEEAHPHLVVIDLMLKTGNGLEVIRRTRSSRPDLKFLVLTMHESAQHAEQAIRAGAVGYLTKREATQRILEAIRTVLSGRQFLSAAVVAQMFNRESPGVSAHAGVAKLSDRELQVLRLFGEALTARLVADRIGLDVRTVETYRARICEKLGLASAHELLRFAIEWKNDGGGAN